MTDSLRLSSLTGFDSGRGSSASLGQQTAGGGASGGGVGGSSSGGRMPSRRRDSSKMEAAGIASGDSNGGGRSSLPIVPLHQMVINDELTVIVWKV